LVGKEEGIMPLAGHTLETSSEMEKNMKTINCSVLAVAIIVARIFVWSSFALANGTSLTLLYTSNTKAKVDPSC
jgi:hypothetical protein